MLKYHDLDTLYQDAITCPHCGQIASYYIDIIGDHLEGETTVVCDECDKEYEVDWTVTFTFSTRPTVRAKELTNGQ